MGATTLRSCMQFQSVKFQTIGWMRLERWPGPASRKPRVGAPRFLLWVVIQEGRCGLIFSLKNAVVRRPALRFGIIAVYISAPNIFVLTPRSRKRYVLEVVRVTHLEIDEFTMNAICPQDICLAHSPAECVTEYRHRNASLFPKWHASNCVHLLPILWIAVANNRATKRAGGTTRTSKVPDAGLTPD